MIINCDVDGVLNNLMDVTLEVYNKRYGTLYTLKDITNYHLENCFEPFRKKLNHNTSLTIPKIIANKIHPILKSPPKIIIQNISAT